MDVPLSWIKDFVEVDLALDEVARLLTGCGLEVEGVRVVGLPMPSSVVYGERMEFKFSGLSWEPDKIVVAQIDEVLPHPNADRLTLCKLNDGAQEHIVLTGAPNLFPFKGQGPLPKPLKVAYAKEGAKIYDGHQPGQVLTTLKRAKIRGVDSYSMVCSEKELGISEEHEGVIILDEDAPTGMPLVDYMGDAVYSISILPNMIRNACVIGVAREIAAATQMPMHLPERKLPSDGPSIEGKAFLRIGDPKLNPRFVLGLVQGAQAKESPYWVQRRLRLAGMRPINSIVDATNYVMLETGEPLHAFDYDVLVKRAGGKAPTIITRTAEEGEKLTTLDGQERPLEPYMILVCDTAGALSLAGVMGGAESEVTEATRNVLLEGASWNFVNVRKAMTTLRMNSEAGFRFSRGVHPALAPQGVTAGLLRIAEWSGGQISAGLVDAYPRPVEDPVVPISVEDVQDLLGIDLTAQEIAGLLSRLEFACTVDGNTVRAKTPPHRLDIGDEEIGRADVLEEIARTYGYDRIPQSRLKATLPEQVRDPRLDLEEKVRDILVSQGLQEVATYRMTTPEREARLLPPGVAIPQDPYVRIANPISAERVAMRRSLLSSLVEVLERNSRLRDRLGFFEVGPVFWPVEGQSLPYEPVRLAILLMGVRHPTAWDLKQNPQLDFFDLKGILEGLLDELHIDGVTFAPAGDVPTFHPGKCAELRMGEVSLGVIGELHPLVKERLDVPYPVIAADLDLEAMLSAVPTRYEVSSMTSYPPVLEDIAVVVEEDLPAEKVMAAIRQGGGKLLTGIRLFDIFRGDQIGSGKKSLAFSLTYQAPDRTLTDTDANQIRQRIIRRLEQELGAKLRS